MAVRYGLNATEAGTRRYPLLRTPAKCEAMRSPVKLQASLRFRQVPQLRPGSSLWKPAFPLKCAKRRRSLSKLQSSHAESDGVLRLSYGGCRPESLRKALTQMTATEKQICRRLDLGADGPAGWSGTGVVCSTSTVRAKKGAKPNPTMNLGRGR